MTLSCRWIAMTDGRRHSGPRQDALLLKLFHASLSRRLTGIPVPAAFFVFWVTFVFLAWVVLSGE